jgi:lysozyme
VKIKYFLIAGGGFLAYDWFNRNPSDSLLIGTLMDIVATLKGLIGTNMKTSANGKIQIEQREGNRAVVYADVSGNLTAGIGHLLQPADGNYSLGDTVTPQQIATWFASDIAHAENIVNASVSGVILDQNEFDALVSAAFNLGTKLFRNSNGTETGFSAALNAGDYATAMQHFLLFDKSGGVQVAGLDTRRASEQAQFNA